MFGKEEAAQVGQKPLYSIMIRYYEPSGALSCDTDPDLTLFLMSYDASNNQRDWCNFPIDHDPSAFGRARCCCEVP